MTNFSEIRLQQEQKLKKSLKHLIYTYKKIQNLPIKYEELDEEQLETWESFAARFSRTADFFLTRYIRTRVLQEDPGFSGSFRDYLNQAEKMGLIENVKDWMAIRELRNLTVHEYMEDDLTRFFYLIKQSTPQLLDIEKLLNSNDN